MNQDASLIPQVNLALSKASVICKEQDLLSYLTYVGLTK